MYYRIFLLNILFLSLLFVSCNKDDKDSNTLTPKAKVVLEEFPGHYDLMSMKWTGPTIDIDADGVEDVDIKTSQVEFADVCGYAYAPYFEALNKDEGSSLGLPVSNLDFRVVEPYNFTNKPVQMIRYLTPCSINAEGAISYAPYDFENGTGGYAKNIEVIYDCGFLIVTADINVWDYFTHSIIDGKIELVYRKTQK